MVTPGESNNTSPSPREKLLLHAAEILGFTFKSFIGSYIRGHGVTGRAKEFVQTSETS
jgi:hypothetical protein